MSADCDICRGSRVIRLPVYVPVSAGPVGEPLALGGETSRQYPCPECARGDVVPFTRLQMVNESRRGPIHFWDKTDFIDAMRRNLAVAIGMDMLRAGLIGFRQESIEQFGRVGFVMLARAEVVAPRDVKTMDERVAERQFEVAETVTADAIEDVANWNSHYQGRDSGYIEKGHVFRAIRKALEKVKAKYGK